MDKHQLVADVKLRVKYRSLIVLSYVYCDRFGLEQLVTETMVVDYGDFRPIQDAADEMHRVAKRAGGKILHALVTVVPPEQVGRVNDRD